MERRLPLHRFPDVYGPLMGRTGDHRTRELWRSWLVVVLGFQPLSRSTDPMRRNRPSYCRPDYGYTEIRIIYALK